MNSGEGEAAAWFSAASDGSDTADVTRQVYAFFAVGAVIGIALMWWLSPVESAWLTVGVGVIGGSIAGYVGWNLWSLARSVVRQRRMMRLAIDDPEDFRRRYGPPSD